MTDLIRYILINDSNVLSDSGGQVFVDESPQGIETPYIVLQVAEGDVNDSKDKVSSLDQVRVTVFCYGEVQHNKVGKIGAYSMLENCREALDHYSDPSLYVRAFDTPSTFSARIKNDRLFIAEQDFEVYLTR